MPKRRSFTSKSSPGCGSEDGAAADRGAAEHEPLRPGALYVVATPLGNLGDITLRALEVLRGVDRIAAEDTRRTRVLLAHYGIRTPMLALHAHNEASRSAELVQALEAGGTLALVSDAGTPLLSDPGFPLVRAARAAGCPVLAVPGPCAAVAALSVAGLPVSRFAFEGFLPARPAARRAAIEVLAQEPRTLVFYESPHRVRALVADLTAAFGEEREAALAKELTKLHESVAGPTLGAIGTWLDADVQRVRGEFVLAVAGAPPRAAHAEVLDALLDRLVPVLGVRAAADAAAVLAAVGRNAAYKRALERPCARRADPADCDHAAESGG